MANPQLTVKLFNNSSANGPSYHTSEVPFTSYADAWSYLNLATAAWQEGFLAAHGESLRSWEMDATATVTLDGQQQQMGIIRGSSEQEWSAEGLHGAEDFQPPKDTLLATRYMITANNMVDTKGCRLTSLPPTLPDSIMLGIGCSSIHPSLSGIMNEFGELSSESGHVHFNTLDLLTGEHLQFSSYVLPSEPDCTQSPNLQDTHAWRSLSETELECFVPESVQTESTQTAECCLHCGLVRIARHDAPGEHHVEYVASVMDSQTHERWAQSHPPVTSQGDQPPIMRARIVKVTANEWEQPHTIDIMEYRGMKESQRTLSKIIERRHSHFSTDHLSHQYAVQVRAPGKSPWWVTVVQGTWDPSLQEAVCINRQTWPCSVFLSTFTPYDMTKRSLQEFSLFNPLETPVVEGEEHSNFHAWDGDPSKRTLEHGTLCVLNLLSGEVMVGPPTQTMRESILPLDTTSHETREQPVMPSLL